MEEIMKFVLDLMILSEFVVAFLLYVEHRNRDSDVVIRVINRLYNIIITVAIICGSYVIYYACVKLGR